jgi:alkylation response protein AidB-like acyl-CoA dehydrogenase
MMHPKAFGGAQASFVSVVQVIEELARQDGAVGWNAAIMIGGGMIADCLPEDTTRKILAGGDFVGPGRFDPLGQAYPVPGGYRVSGRWSFMSACQNANWIVCGAVVVEEDKPRLNPDGSPYWHQFLIASTACEIIDTWHTTGLRGTGSHDIAVSDVFVPDDHTFPGVYLFSGPPERQSRAYATALLEAGALMLAAVALGIAQDAMESFIALAARKTPSGAPGPLASLATAQEKAGLAAATLRSARSFVYEVARDLGAKGSLAQAFISPARLAGAYAARAAIDVVDSLFEAGGGSSVYDSSRLERCFRDAHMITHHVLVSSSAFVAAGAALLNPPPPASA